MAKKSQRKLNRSKGNHVGIDGHKRIKNRLVTPFNQIPNTTHMSWVDDRLPCMVWGALLINGIGRERALEVFRNIGINVGSLFSETEERVCDLPRVGLYGISTLCTDLQDLYFEVLFSEQGASQSLRPLLLFRDLPLFDRWNKQLSIVTDIPEESLWISLAEAVTMLLDHQSQISTDCRWAYMIPIVYSGKLRLQTEEQFREFAEFPYFEDQRKERPSIRAMEIQFGSGMSNEHYSQSKRAWSNRFWDECKARTECFAPESKKATVDYNLLKTIEGLHLLWRDLSIHFSATDDFTHVQPKRDSSFGFCFYALALTQEGLASSGKLLTAKLALRMLAEIYITFKYLQSVGDEKLWSVYRAHGSGQAKLTFLKLDENLSGQPGYLKKETIEALANEDLYLDFQDINLGNWANVDLRTMSQVAGCKDIYDNYYSWPSSYAHGQWCAVRDVVFTTCYNPLHRLHRIPRPSPRYEDGAEHDLVLLFNRILELLNNIYPGFDARAELVPK